MHLKLKTHFPSASGQAWLLALALKMGAISAALLLIDRPAGIGALASEQTGPLRGGGMDELALKRQEGAPERRCAPMLNIVLPQARSEAALTAPTERRPDEAASRKSVRSAAAATTTATATAASGSGMPASFAFAISDIDMPLAQTASPLQSAMRILSTLDSQLGAGFDSDGDGDGDGTELDAAGERAPRESSIRFVQNRLHISALNLTMLNFHLYADSQPRFALAVNIGNATLTGQFFYDGITPSLMGADLVSKLAGHYRMSIDNVLVTASSNLTKERAAGWQAPFSYRLATNDLRVNISNLGYISIDILDAHDSTKATSNYLLKMLQRVLQKSIKRTYNKFEAYIRETLEMEGRRFLDCELSRFSPILSENQADPREPMGLPEGAQEAGSSSAARQQMANNLDDLARIVSSEIRNSRLDRVAMPNFEYRRRLLGTNALIVFTNGSLSGLDNLRLLGEAKVKLQDQHLIVNASLGWFNLRPQYNWTLYLGSSVAGAGAGGPQPEPQPELQQGLPASSPPPVKATAAGFVGANIRAIEFDTLISRSLRQSRTRVTVDELLIRRLDGSKLDIGGLPGINRLARATVNFFMGRLKQRLVSSMQPLLKQELERALNRLTLSE